MGVGIGKDIKIKTATGCSSFNRAYAVPIDLPMKLQQVKILAVYQYFIIATTLHVCGPIICFSAQTTTIWQICAPKDAGIRDNVTDDACSRLSKCMKYDSAALCITTDFGHNSHVNTA